MAGDFSWRLLQGIREQAAMHGESIAEAMGFSSPPIDPFRIIQDERRIIPVGADFGSAFDGRLEFQAPDFLLFYNTKFNQWPHAGTHHPKVRFSISHELGHYFIDEHRDYLRRGGGPHRSFAEFKADPTVEQQADAFAGGLLMPSYLLSEIVNADSAATLDAIKEAREVFDVSLVSMMVRWVQLSHFPCATVAVSRTGSIKWGFVSEGFKRAGAYRAIRDESVRSKDAARFVNVDPSCTKYRDSTGNGLAHHWIDTDRKDLSVDEFYVAIPYRQEVLTFIVADEDEMSGRYEEDTDDD